MIFGNNGDSYSKAGNTTFKSGKNPGSVFHSGDMAFGSDGSFRSDAGDMSFGSGGTISKAGNTYFKNGKTYTRSGNMLFGPDGKSWSGDLDDQSIRDIISGDD